jgi:hypothetical protein
MPNRLFYTVKLHSEKIIANKLKINMTFEELLRHGNIISLADSQMLKLIRQLTHHEINLEQLEEWYLERDKIKKRANSKENREVIKKLQKQIIKYNKI